MRTWKTAKKPFSLTERHERESCTAQGRETPLSTTLPPFGVHKRRGHRTVEGVAERDLSVAVLGKLRVGPMVTCELVPSTLGDIKAPEAERTMDLWNHQKVQKIRILQGIRLRTPPLRARNSGSAEQGEESRNAQENLRATSLGLEQLTGCVGGP